MASIKISGLPEPRVQTKTFTYSDLHLDLQKKYLTKMIDFTEFLKK